MLEMLMRECKSILTRSRIPGIDYTICPYIGCAHQCIYCYVRFMGFVRDDWDQTLYVKINNVDRGYFFRVKDLIIKYCKECGIGYEKCF